MALFIVWTTFSDSYNIFCHFQKSCSVRALGVLIIPVLLAIVAALALIVLQVVNIIITVLVLATNFGVSIFCFSVYIPMASCIINTCTSLLHVIFYECEHGRV